MALEEPKVFLDATYRIRSYESGVENGVTLPTLCNYMQEAAGESAASLGWGIRELQAGGLTWMLSRLHVKVARYAPWGETLTMRTWPSGMKGRLVANRCFQAADASGEEVLRARSEWLYVDFKAQKIVKLPESFAELVPPGTPEFDFPDIGGKVASLPAVTHRAEIRVRKSDLDFNDHANNVHYVEWMLEALPGEARPAELDVVFRTAAKAGDVLASECFVDGGRSLHVVRREGDGATLATAAMAWRRPAKVVLCLGSNLEPRLESLDRAQDALCALPSTRFVAASSTRETEPDGVPPEFAGMKFLNRVLVVETELPPKDFASRMFEIEKALGRVRGGRRNEPRTIDVDMIDYEGVRSDDPELTLPHPRAAARSFVMEPMAELGLSLPST